MAISNPESGVEASRKRRRREGEEEGEGEGGSAPSPSAWRSGRAQKLYSSKLLEALRRVRRNNTAAAAAATTPRSRLVREAADRALAVAARGRTRWSRAILAKARAGQRRLAASARRPEIGGADPASAAAARRRRRRRRGRGVEGKERVLGRLVPGGRRLSFPKLIEEASDYIAALEMQVRAMSALARVLSALGPDRPGSSQPDRTGSSEPA